jgi:hydrogenase maturation factor
VDKDSADAVVERLIEAGEAAAIIGEVQRGTHDVQIV